MMSDKYISPWATAYLAGCAAGPFTANPFIYPDPRHEAWERGANDARERAEAEMFGDD